MQHKVNDVRGEDIISGWEIHSAAVWGYWASILSRIRDWNRCATTPYTPWTYPTGQQNWPFETGQWTMVRVNARRACCLSQTIRLLCWLAEAEPSGSMTPTNAIQGIKKRRWLTNNPCLPSLQFDYSGPNLPSVLFLPCDWKEEDLDCEYVLSSKLSRACVLRVLNDG